MGVGIWIMVYKSDYQSLLDSDIYVIVPGLMIAAGVVVIIVGIVGCLGAAKENRFFLISVSSLCSFDIISLCVMPYFNFKLLDSLVHYLLTCYLLFGPRAMQYNQSSNNK